MRHEFSKPTKREALKRSGTFKAQARATSPVTGKFDGDIMSRRHE